MNILGTSLICFSFGHRPENGPFIERKTCIQPTKPNSWGYTGWWVVDLPWKIMDFVSWVYEIPNWMESHNPAMFQSPPTRWDIPGDHQSSEKHPTAVPLTAPPTEDMILESCTHPLVYHYFILFSHSHSGIPDVNTHNQHIGAFECPIINVYKAINSLSLWIDCSLGQITRNSPYQPPVLASKLHRKAWASARICWVVFQRDSPEICMICLGNSMGLPQEKAREIHGKYWDDHGKSWVYMGLYPLVVQHTYGKIDEDGPFIDVWWFTYKHGDLP